MNDGPLVPGREDTQTWSMRSGRVPGPRTGVVDVRPRSRKTKWHAPVTIRRTPGDGGRTATAPGTDALSGRPEREEDGRRGGREGPMEETVRQSIQGRTNTHGVFADSQ